MTAERRHLLADMSLSPGQVGPRLEMRSEADSAFVDEPGWAACAGLGECSLMELRLASAASESSPCVVIVID